MYQERELRILNKSFWKKLAVLVWTWEYTGNELPCLLRSSAALSAISFSDAAQIRAEEICSSVLEQHTISFCVMLMLDSFRSLV